MCATDSPQASLHPVLSAGRLGGIECWGTGAHLQELDLVLELPDLLLQRLDNEGWIGFLVHGCSVGHHRHTLREPACADALINVRLHSALGKHSVG